MIFKGNKLKVGRKHWFGYCMIRVCVCVCVCVCVVCVCEMCFAYSCRVGCLLYRFHDTQRLKVKVAAAY